MLRIRKIWRCFNPPCPDHEDFFATIAVRVVSIHTRSNFVDRSLKKLNEKDVMLRLMVGWNLGMVENVTPLHPTNKAHSIFFPVTPKTSPQRDKGKGKGDPPLRNTGDNTKGTDWFLDGL